MKKILSGLLVLFLFLNYGCSLNDTEKYLQDLKSENVMVQKNAIYYLGEEEEKRAVPFLVHLLSKDQTKEIRLSAIEALGKIGEDSSVDILISVLEEKDKDIKRAAVEALGKIKSSKAVIPLINLLYEEDVRLTVIWALGNIGDKSAVPTLMPLLGGDDKLIRYNASQALKNIGR